MPIHDVMYRSNVTKYCETEGDNCAILKVLSAVGFLHVPDDLFPNQTFRVAEILQKASKK